MSRFILDTDALSLLQRNHPIVVQHVAATPRSELAVSIITVQEQVTGRFAFIQRAKQPDRIALGYELLTETVRSLISTPILSYTEPAVHRFLALVRMRLNVGRMDLRIAAIALEFGAVVVTRNVRDFRRVPGLTIEDWTV